MYTSNYRIKVIKTSSSCLVSLRDGSHAVDHQLWDLSLVGQEHRKRLRRWGELDLQHPGVPHVPPPGSVFHLLRSVSEPSQLAVNSLRLLLIRSRAITQWSILSIYPTGWALTQPFPEWCLCNCVVPSRLNQQRGSISVPRSQRPFLSSALSLPQQVSPQTGRKRPFVGSRRSIRQVGWRKHPEIINLRCWSGFSQAITAAWDRCRSFHLKWQENRDHRGQKISGKPRLFVSRSRLLFTRVENMERCVSALWLQLLLMNEEKYFCL